jgi:hypothetical protein
MRFIALAILFTTLTCSAQFDRAGGEPGSKSIKNDDASITAWASGANIQRGKLQIDQPNSSLATLGDSVSATGPFDGDVLSLGDSGVVTLSFDDPIQNNTGYDFAVFENGFKVGLSYYLELAHVEVSENGTDFVRFPSESLSDTGFQTDNFGYTDPTKLRNLAGKHQAPYGTLFDIDEVGLEQVNYVRLIDVVGSLNDRFGSRDSKGRLINDPWPTPFASSGFDLDAVAVVNGRLLSVLSPEAFAKANPLVSNTIASGQRLELKPEWKNSVVSCRDMSGRLVSAFSAELPKLTVSGMYTVAVQKSSQLWVQKIIVY